jgi:hypothetical protein
MHPAYVVDLPFLHPAICATRGRIARWAAGPLRDQPVSLCGRWCGRCGRCGRCFTYTLSFFSKLRMTGSSATTMTISAGAITTSTGKSGDRTLSHAGTPRAKPDVEQLRPLFREKHGEGRKEFTARPDRCGLTNRASMHTACVGDLKRWALSEFRPPGNDASWRA